MCSRNAAFRGSQRSGEERREKGRRREVSPAADVEAAGIEPSCDSDATDSSVCDCENCQQCRAANALHFECFKWQFLASLDARLRDLILAWDHTPDARRTAVASLVKA